MKCEICERQMDLRHGACFDCANAESLVSEGLTMFDKKPKELKNYSSHMSIVREILKSYLRLKYDEIYKTEGD